MPNRNGMTTDHGLWPGKGMGNGGKPDVKAVACMKDCATEPKVASFLPDFARNATATWPSRTAWWARSAVPTPRARPASAGGAGSRRRAARPRRRRCAARAPRGWPEAPAPACHGVDNKIVGPALREIAKKYASRADAEAYLTGKIKAAAGRLGPHPDAAADPARRPTRKAIAKWLAEGAKK
jgi:S-disulfanyl-L-cysteine oxidoreductase SoxD